MTLNVTVSYTPRHTLRTCRGSRRPAADPGVYYSAMDGHDSAASDTLPTGGTVRPVTRWGTEVMHRPARPVTSYDEELRALVADMVATMYAADGVGLAACQIGVDLAVFVFDCPDESGTRRRGVVCNPVVDL